MRKGQLFTVKNSPLADDYSYDHLVGLQVSYVLPCKAEHLKDQHYVKAVTGMYADMGNWHVHEQDLVPVEMDNESALSLLNQD